MKPGLYLLLFFIGANVQLSLAQSNPSSRETTKPLNYQEIESSKLDDSLIIVKTDFIRGHAAEIAFNKRSWKAISRTVVVNGITISTQTFTASCGLNNGTIFAEATGMPVEGR